jgi:hypothetical protein
LKSASGKRDGRSNPSVVDADSDPIVKSNLPSSSPKRNEVQALDLSESEEEVELEDLHEYFMAKEGVVRGLFN